MSQRFIVIIVLTTIIDAAMAAKELGWSPLSNDADDFIPSGQKYLNNTIGISMTSNGNDGDGGFINQIIHNKTENQIYLIRYEDNVYHHHEINHTISLNNGYLFRLQRMDNKLVSLINDDLFKLSKNEKTMMNNNKTNKSSIAKIYASIIETSDFGRIFYAFKTYDSQYYYSIFYSEKQQKRWPHLFQTMMTTYPHPHHFILISGVNHIYVIVYESLKQNLRFYYIDLSSSVKQEKPKLQIIGHLNIEFTTKSLYITTRQSNYDENYRAERMIFLSYDYGFIIMQKHGLKDLVLISSSNQTVLLVDSYIIHTKRKKFQFKILKFNEYFKLYESPNSWQIAKIKPKLPTTITKDDVKIKKNPIGKNMKMMTTTTTTTLMINKSPSSSLSESKWSNSLKTKLNQEKTLLIVLLSIILTLLFMICIATTLYKNRLKSLPSSLQIHPFVKDSSSSPPPLSTTTTIALFSSPTPQPRPQFRLLSKNNNQESIRKIIYRYRHKNYPRKQQVNKNAIVDPSL
ncbi:hypothetical protein DERF_010825 [Dermatophagoides farinae]|uniref:Transmembrane protein n=1 Tax=Dermatophagoides farinae TaxID=6954 RepID=A0A922KZJ4_DERFA|nr:hypothetical protein DERF_010825 [Dermatophagoides farinae]